MWILFCCITEIRMFVFFSQTVYLQYWNEKISFEDRWLFYCFLVPRKLALRGLKLYNFYMINFCLPLRYLYSRLSCHRSLAKRKTIPRLTIASLPKWQCACVCVHQEVRLYVFVSLCLWKCVRVCKNFCFQGEEAQKLLYWGAHQSCF